MKNEDRVTATRARLIDAAIDALAEIGYHKTTFVEVSRRSELSRGAIHHHFESIPDLMGAVARDISRRIQESVSEDLAGIPSDGDIFEAGIDFVWKQMQHTPYRALDQIRAALATDEALQRIVKNDDVDVVEWLQQQLRSKISHKSVRASSLDPNLIRLVLSSLAGAATQDIAVGTPSEDPDRSAYLAAAKKVAREFNAKCPEATTPRSEPVSA